MAASAPFSVKAQRSPAAPEELLQVGALAALQDALPCPAAAPNRYKTLAASRAVAPNTGRCHTALLLLGHASRATVPKPPKQVFSLTPS